MRRLEGGDIDGVLALLEAVAAEGRWIGTESGFDRDARRERLRDMMADPKAVSLVALDGSDVVGECSIYPHPEHGHVLAMLVERARRGRGIGCALLEAALAWARERALPSLSLHVFAHNDRALRLYAAAGFQAREGGDFEIARRSGEVYRAILMTKLL